MPGMLYLFLNWLSMGSLDTTSQMHIAAIANCYWLQSKLEGKAMHEEPHTWILRHGEHRLVITGKLYSY